MADGEEAVAVELELSESLTLRKFWSGKVPLPQAFWRFGVLYGTLLNILASITALAMVTTGLEPWACAAVFVIPIPYNLMAAISVWRSAAAWQGAPIWSQLAKYGIIGWATVASVF